MERAIITGGSSGIGLAIAKRLLHDGFAVTIVGRNEKRLREAVLTLGGNADYIAGDVSSRSGANAIAAEVIGHYGKIAVLVNNAGVMMNTTLETPEDELEALWDETFNTNLKGVMFLTRALAPALQAPGGRVVNMTSNVAFNGGSVPGLSVYSASKAGLVGLTYALARELAPRDITVNAIAPGMIEDTGLTGTFDDERKAKIKQVLPLGRPGKPGEVAAAVSYLVSEGGAYVTGTVLPVNGGWIFR